MIHVVEGEQQKSEGRPEPGHSVYVELAQVESLFSSMPSASSALMVVHVIAKDGAMREPTQIKFNRVILGGRLISDLLDM